MKISEKVHKSWYNIIGQVLREPFISFDEKLRENVFYPKYEDIFNVFEMPLQDIRVVILGNNPYKTSTFNLGYSWAVHEYGETPLPLHILHAEATRAKVSKNIKDIKEWQNLSHWREQGVFLLNRNLTVGFTEDHTAYWAVFMQNVIKYISIHNPCIWIAWGENYIPYLSAIRNKYSVKLYEEEGLLDNMPISPDFNYLLYSKNPVINYNDNSTIFGCNHFNLANYVLDELNKKQIYW